MDPVAHSRMHGLMERWVERWAQAKIKAAASTLPGIDVSGSVPKGCPVDELQRLAPERGAALLVSGTAARQGVQHFLHGSVAGRLAKDAPCPVVTVPPDAAIAEPGPVLVGDDGSDQGRLAVRHGGALAQRLGRDVMRMQVEDGDPVEAMAGAAREHRACVVVTGTRGRGPLRSELFGSVSRGMVREARRPVVLVSSSTGAPMPPTRG